MSTRRLLLALVAALLLLAAGGFLPLGLPRPGLLLGACLAALDAALVAHVVRRDSLVSAAMVAAGSLVAVLGSLALA